jgi:hypothetical protein
MIIPAIPPRLIESLLEEVAAAPEEAAPAAAPVVGLNVGLLTMKGSRVTALEFTFINTVHCNPTA